MPGRYLTAVRRSNPVIHNITNYVTSNDVANILLACGASPIMADAPEEAEKIVSASDGLCINIGTLNSMTAASMLSAAKKAAELGIPSVLDPVGAAAGAYRAETSIRLMKEAGFSVIRGNLSEISVLAGEFGNCSLCLGKPRGVDTAVTDGISEEDIEQLAESAMDFSEKCGSVIVITGKQDLVCDSSRCLIIENGRAEMSRVTGTGCQLSALTAAFIAASPDNVFEASASAVCTMGVAGEIAWNGIDRFPGNGTYRNRIIDEVYCMYEETIEMRAKIRILK